MRKLLIAALLLLAGPVWAQNYQATQGAGTTFGTKLVGGVNYPQWVICDPTTPANCAVVNASGQLSIIQASGSVASGAYSAGAYAAGAVVAGAFVDGWDVTQGTKADAAWVSGSGSVIALLKNIATGVGSSIPAGTAVIGKVGIDQTTPGTTNAVSATNFPATVATGTGAQGATVPRATVATDTATIAGSAPGTQTAPSSNYVAVNSGDPCFGAAKTTAPFSTSSGGPVSIVALSGSTKVYVCSITAVTDTAIKLSFIDGTGGSCASTQHAIWGSTTAASGMSLGATGGFASGNGGGTVGVTAAASAFCLLQSGTSLVAGSITYVQQ